MNQPYQSDWYEKTYAYERFGNYIVNPGEEIYVYITDYMIPGVEFQRYAISNYLRVYDYYKNRFLGYFKSNGYLQVSLFIPNRKRNMAFGLHRLYMLVFCYFVSCESYDINYIDGNKSNCHPSNLEWKTHRDNMVHAIDNNLIQRKITDQQIIEIINAYNNYEPVKDIAKRYGITSGYISDILRSNKSKRLIEIRLLHPITREKSNKKDQERKPVKIYTKRLEKLYGTNSTNFTRTSLNSKNVEDICSIFESLKDSNMKPGEKYDYCINQLGLENINRIRDKLSYIYNGRSYRNISSKYSFIDKSSETIEKVAR